MKRLPWLALLVGLPLLALPARARADGVPLYLPCLPPFKVDAGIKAYLTVTYPGPQQNLPPWYTYFPYDAYFQTPSPTGFQFPNWPAPQASSAAFGHHFAPPMMAAPPHAAPSPSPVRPVGYYYQAPSYWYGR
jgi:hypothetical protein